MNCWTTKVCALTAKTEQFNLRFILVNTSNTHLKATNCQQSSVKIQLIVKDANLSRRTVQNKKLLKDNVQEVAIKVRKTKPASEQFINQKSNGTRKCEKPRNPQELII